MKALQRIFKKSSECEVDNMVLFKVCLVMIGFALGLILSAKVDDYIERKNQYNESDMD